VSANAANGYVSYEAESEWFYLTPEQTAVFATEDSPANMHGLLQIIVAQYAEHETAVDVFRSGKGRPWGDRHTCQFCGTGRFFRPGYIANLVTNWITALDGVQQKLEAGGTIADIGCGHGSTSVLMAETFPNSKVFGYDIHGPSIDDARSKAAAAGVDNIIFDRADASNIPSNGGYDFACVFDALHDMGDPVGVAQHLRESLAPGGILYGVSTLICLPNWRSQDVALCLGAQAGPKRLIAVLEDAGFSSVRIATTSSTNIVLEATA
jgi:2-polyprenyl-3-methyl-5-hydroxy-6-metoxy-1,4-benzoquinol methylase